MSESVDPKVQRARERRAFWNEVVVPTARGLESFGWRVVFASLVIYIITRSLCL